MIFKTTKESLEELEKKIETCLKCQKKHCFKGCQFFLQPSELLKLIREYKRLLP